MGAAEAKFPHVLMAAAVTLWVIGFATLPRHLAMLNRALGATGDAAQDLHYRAMVPGLTRLIVADRLMPSPAIIVAAVLMVLLAEPLLALARDRRAVLWALAALGLAPLVVQSLGEVVLAYLQKYEGRPTPGEALSLTSGFKTGPMLLWGGGSPPPRWLVVLDARVNLIALWCASLWALALRTVDGGKLRVWHIGVPVASLALSGVVTWVLGPLVVAAILGQPDVW